MNPNECCNVSGESARRRRKAYASVAIDGTQRNVRKIRPIATAETRKGTRRVQAAFAPARGRPREGQGEGCHAGHCRPTRGDPSVTGASCFPLFILRPASRVIPKGSERRIVKRDPRGEAPFSLSLSPCRPLLSFSPLHAD